MAYDEGLAHRIREILRNESNLVEKKMFGGTAFMVHGNMAVGVMGNEVMVRVGLVGEAETLSEPHTRPFDKSGRPMKGWILVSAEGSAEDEDLHRWVMRGVSFSLSLPPK